MSQIPATLVLQRLALAFAIIGLAVTIAGLSSISVPSPVDATASVGQLITGVFFVFIALAGPLRIILTGALIPAEVKRTIFILGSCLLLAGGALTTAALFGNVMANSTAFLVAGISALISAYFGFWYLGKQLPGNFYIDEMLSVMKSAGLLGSKNNSPANRELLRWSKGIRAGVAVGLAAPDGMIVKLNGETGHLSDFFNQGQDSSPLVLNFGSYTCPHHRKRLDELHGLMDKWQNRGVRFLTIYTAEAHPDDGWRLANQYAQDKEYNGNENDFCFSYAKTIEDRLTMANWLIEKKNFRMDMVLDAMENKLLFAYNSWPIRLYVIKKGKIIYSGKQGPFGYLPDEVDAALKINSD